MTFTEKQRFKQWWVWFSILLIAGICGWALVQQFIFKIPFGKNPASNTTLLFLCLSPILMVMLFRWLKLETEINKEGVYYKFTPFHLKKKFIGWNDISEAYVRTYKPIQEYGGWGIKGSLRNGKAYNVSGNMGLQLVLKNGKKILLGTGKADELMAFLLNLKK